jgi:hypothetical protein
LYHVKSQFGTFTIVNPGENYNELDFATGLPGRRLIFNSRGIENNFYFIYFQRGGSSVQNYLYIVQYEKRSITNFVAVSIDSNAKTFDSLKSALSNKAYHLIK